MIVCKQCGHHNEEGDTFCGSCGSFLEWVGEKVAEDEPEPEPVAVVEEEGEKKHGLLTRIKEKIAGEDDDDVPGATEDPGAGRDLPADQREPEVAPVVAPTVAAVAATAAPEVVTKPPLEAPGSSLDTPAAASAGLAAPTPPAGLTPPPPGGLAAPGSGPATLPPPPAASPEEVARQAAAAKQAEAEAKRKADEEARRQAEQAKREAEEEAKRKEEEAKRRAALLVAKPKAVETPEQAKATTAAVPTTTEKKGKGAKAPAATAAAATVAATETKAPTAQQPGAQQPGAASKARPKTVKEAPSRAIKPGDLVCGDCGEGNDAGRKFCRRCGASLVDAPVAKKPGFFKRLFTRKPKAAPEAGSRPGRGGGGSGKKGDLGRTGRQAKGKFLGVFANGRQALAILAIFGIGVGLAIPNVRSRAFEFMNGGVGSIKGIISPTFTTVFVDQAQTIASSETPGAAAALASNNIKNDHWAPAPTDAAPQLQLRFEDPTNLDILFVYSGNQDDPKNFAANPRPKDIFVTLVDTDLKKTEKQIRLDDTDKAQKFDLKGKDVETVIVDIQSCFPDPQNRSCSIAELEFQKKK